MVVAAVGSAAPSRSDPITVATFREIGGALIDSLPDALLVELAEGARWLRLLPGTEVFSDDSDRTAIIDRGIVRSYLRAADGRQLTVRYARHGAMVGTLDRLGRNLARIRLRSVSDCMLIEIDRVRFFALVDADAHMGRAVVAETVRRLNDIYGALAVEAFGTLRERLIRHLLELTEEDPVTGIALAPVTQQQLADSVGTAREVVARSLATLRSEGLIRTGRGHITILDPPRLAEIVAGWIEG